MAQLVTIILPVYNQQDFIKESIKSLLAQTYPNFELIVIDDASTDGTFNLIKEFVDSRIVIIRNERNEGLSASVNKGIRLAKGEYIARMDADDISLPQR